MGIDDDNGAGTPAGQDDRPAGYDVVVAETLVRDAKRIAELEAALRLCIDNCIDPTEGEVALTRAREVLQRQ